VLGKHSIKKMLKGKGQNWEGGRERRKRGLRAKGGSAFSQWEKKASTKKKENPKFRMLIKRRLKELSRPLWDKTRENFCHHDIDKDIREGESISFSKRDSQGKKKAESEGIRKSIKMETSSAPASVQQGSGVSRMLRVLERTKMFEKDVLEGWK